MNENQTAVLGKVQMTPRGEYNPETAYAFLDIVSYGGGSYLAKKPSTNVPITNTTYWLCLAEKGNTGEAAGFGTPTIAVSELDPDSTPTAQITEEGPDTEKIFHFVFGIPQGQKGDTGNGIESIEKTDTEGNVDTYTITYTDGTTTTFEVTNGIDGESAGFGTPTATIDSEVGTPYVEITETGPDTAKVFNFAFHNMKGVPGVSPGVTVTETEGGHEVTITDKDHPDGQTFEVMDGVDGVSVTGVELISTEGAVKTYRMSFSDETYFDYEVADGEVTQEQFDELAETVDENTDNIAANSRQIANLAAVRVGKDANNKFCYIEEVED